MGELARIEGPKLTDMQQAFVDAILNGAEPSDARKLAGYSDETNPRLLLASTAVQAALDRGCDQMLREARPVAVRALIELAKAGPATVKAQAAKIILDQTDAKDGSADKPMSEMSIPELEALIARQEARLKNVTPGNGAHPKGGPAPTD